MKLEEKCLKSELIYRGKILNLRRDVVELPDGRQASREVVEHSGAIGVVALTEDEHVYLVRQYRYPIGKVTLEIPAGKLEEGEDPLDCAIRELKEEAGIEAGHWEPLLTFYTTPGFSNEIMHLFLATELSKKEASPDQDEFLQVVSLPLEEALEKVRRGEIVDAKTILSLLLVRYKFTGRAYPL